MPCAHLSRGRRHDTPDTRRRVVPGEREPRSAARRVDLRRAQRACLFQAAAGAAVHAGRGSRRGRARSHVGVRAILFEPAALVGRRAVVAPAGAGVAHEQPLVASDGRARPLASPHEAVTRRSGGSNSKRRAEPPRRPPARRPRARPRAYSTRMKRSTTLEPPRASCTTAHTVTSPGSAGGTQRTGASSTGPLSGSETSFTSASRSPPSM